jgi:hypothetical protein
MRITRFITIAVILAFAVYGLCRYRSYTARTQADIVAKAIEKFHTDNGQYPATLSQAGLAETNSPGLVYFPHIAQPGLIYDALMPGDFWQYDFKNHDWCYVAS